MTTIINPTADSLNLIAGALQPERPESVNNGEDASPDELERQGLEQQNIMIIKVMITFIVVILVVLLG